MGSFLHFKNESCRAVVANTLIPSTWLWVGGQPGLHSHLEDRLQITTEKPCIKTNKQTNKRRMNLMWSQQVTFSLSWWILSTHILLAIYIRDTGSQSFCIIIASFRSHSDVFYQSKFGNAPCSLIFFWINLRSTPIKISGTLTQWSQFALGFSLSGGYFCNPNLISLLDLFK